MATGKKSPNYPRTGLSETVEHAKAVYRKYGRSVITDADAVTAWGQRGLHGASQGELSALRKYGLLEKAEHGGLRLTKRGVTIAIADPATEQYHDAVNEAALAPELFRQIRQEYPDGLPTDNKLRMDLVTKHDFTESGTTTFIKALRDTFAFAGFDEIDDTDSMGSENVSIAQPLKQAQSPQPTKMAIPGAGAAMSIPIEFITDPETGMRPIFAHITFDVPMKKEHLTMLRSILQAMENEFEKTLGR